MRANRRITLRKKRHTPEEIVSKLRQVDVLVSQDFAAWPAAPARLPGNLNCPIFAPQWDS